MINQCYRIVTISMTRRCPPRIEKNIGYDGDVFSLCAHNNGFAAYLNDGGICVLSLTPECEHSLKVTTAENSKKNSDTSLTPIITKF